MSLFERIGVFTDIHWGEHLDSERHNKDCLEFIDWFIQTVSDEGCDAIAFCGDWFHNKVRTENTTAHYSEIGIRRLSQTGLPIFWIPGNHDIYYKHQRSVHSLPYLSQYRNIRLINDVTLLEDVLFCPWLCGEEFAQVPATKCQYVFGHFELPTFLMNQTIEAPDNGGLHADHFYQCKAVFSGHFHKRQCKINQHGIPIWYIGNAFPHNFNDLHDNERGMMVLDWGAPEPRFHTWPGAPNFHRLTISELLELMEKDGLLRFNDRSVVECENDLNIDDDDFSVVRESLNVREFRWRATKGDIAVDEVEITDETPADFESFVVGLIRQMDTRGHNKDKLVRFFEEA